jgi:RNA polymerase sigma-70 factor (ECF subfamily)
MDDQRAILRLKDGDINGLGFLISKYQVKAVRTAFLVTHNKPLAEDIVQDAFMRFYKRIHQFDECRLFEPYFMTSVVNASLSSALREKRIIPLPQDAEEADLEPLFSRSLSVESEVERSQLKAEMLAYLARLSPRQRAVVVQRYYLEMSEREMSEVSRTAPGTIKWLLNAARTKLRGLLEGERIEE